MKNAKGEPLLYSENDLKNKIQSQLQALKEEVEKLADRKQLSAEGYLLIDGLIEKEEVLNLITNLEDK